MKLRYLIVILMFVTAFSCNKPKRIPDRNLKNIFIEIFLANSYVKVNQMMLDTIDIYTPIISKYGYKYEDISHTFDYYSRRKSARLTEILKAAMDEVGASHAKYSYTINIRDSIYNMLKRNNSNIIVAADSIIVTSFRDTTKLRFEIDAEPGIYRISFLSTFYDDHGSRSSLTSIWNEDSTGEHSVLKNFWRYSGDDRIGYEIETPEHSRRLIISLSSTREGELKPHLRVDSLRISHFPTKEKAMTTYGLELFGYRKPLDDSTRFSNAQDNGKSYLLP